VSGTSSLLSPHLSTLASPPRSTSELGHSARTYSAVRLTASLAAQPRRLLRTLPEERREERRGEERIAEQRRGEDSRGEQRRGEAAPGVVT